MAKVREIAWPDEYSDLKRIEEFMVCGICYEYMETSVMTPCSHNYCSLCIRKYLHYKSQCPACFHVFFEKDLYTNRVMDGLIQHYLQLREKLVTLIQNRVVYDTVVQEDEELPSTPPVRPARSSQFPKSPKILETKNSEPKTPISSSVASTSKCITSSPTTIRSPKIIPSIAKIFNTPKRKEVVSQPVINTKTVSCPVCSVDISEHHVNVHLDACLKREVAQGTLKERPTAPKRPPMPKLVLRVMKDAELRKKMKEFGLSNQGDRRTLENRFNRYSVIYNAECDKLEPRPVADLIRQCEMEERQERKMDSFLVSATASNRLQIERNAKEEKIEEAQKNYRMVNKPSFDKLIEEVRNRRKIEKVKQDDETASSTSKPSTSADTESISESEENTTYNPSAEIAFQDSDSDDCCPLQHYRNDGPTKYVSVNLNDSSSSACGSPTKRPQQVIVKNVDKLKESSAPEKIPYNPYEVPTDVSTDDDVPSSPVLNKNSNRKRVRLSNISLNKSLNKSNSFKSSTSALANDSVVQKDDREVVARDLCNSIINDFSLEGFSDDSSSEFTNKPGKVEVKNVEKVEVSDTLKDSNILNTSTLQKENMNTYCDKTLRQEENRNVLSNGLSNSLDDFSFDVLNADSSDDFVDISVTVTKEVQKEKFDETLEAPCHQSDTKLEKENVPTSANENSQLPVNESTVRRPVRKRNRPMRYAENQTTNQSVRGKTPNRLSEESHESESPDANSADGSLKRRRGRSKLNCTGHPSEESQNPPKRPVRRRQTASDRNL